MAVGSLRSCILVVISNVPLIGVLKVPPPPTSYILHPAPDELHSDVVVNTRREWQREWQKY